MMKIEKVHSLHSQTEKIKKDWEEHVSVCRSWAKVEGNRCEDESGHRPDIPPATLPFLTTPHPTQLFTTLSQHHPNLQEVKQHVWDQHFPQAPKKGFCSPKKDAEKSLRASLLTGAQHFAGKDKGQTCSRARDWGGKWEAKTHQMLLLPQTWSLWDAVSKATHL